MKIALAGFGILSLLFVSSLDAQQAESWKSPWDGKTYYRCQNEWGDQIMVEDAGLCHKGPTKERKITGERVMGSKARTEIKESTLKGGYPACIRQDRLEEWYTANQRAREYLLQSGCVITKAGLPISIVRMTAYGRGVLVRVYPPESSAIEVWTDPDNISWGW